jgi:hypothetical protein
MAKVVKKTKYSLLLKIDKYCKFKKPFSLKGSKSFTFFDIYENNNHNIDQLVQVQIHL